MQKENRRNEKNESRFFIFSRETNSTYSGNCLIETIFPRKRKKFPEKRVLLLLMKRTICTLEGGGIVLDKKKQPKRKHENRTTPLRVSIEEIINAKKEQHSKSKDKKS